MPPNPLAQARSFAARDMPLRGMYIQNSRNFKAGPPPWEILHTPLYNDLHVDYNILHAPVLWGCIGESERDRGYTLTLATATVCRPTYWRTIT